MPQALPASPAPAGHRWAIDLGFSPTAGYLSDRLGRLRIALTALATFGVALALLGFVRFLPLVLAAAVLAYLSDIAWPSSSTP